MIEFPLTYNGREYAGLAAFCRGEGLPYARTAARIKAGRPLRDLFEPSRLGGSRHGLDLGGHTSVREMAEKAGVKYSCMYGRLRSGRTAQEAMRRNVERRLPAVPVPPPSGVKVGIGGIEYPSLGAAARAAGIPPCILYKRWGRGVRGLALFKPVRPRSR